MFTINISRLIEGKSFPTAGTELYNVINDNFVSEDKICLDVNDVSMLPSMFLNMSLGRLIMERGKVSVKNKLVFKHIHKVMAERIQIYFNRFDS